ncbi:MAG: metal ABC transporter substrate-binding protein [Chloroflexota bacterium]
MRRPFSLFLALGLVGLIAVGCVSQAGGSAGAPKVIATTTFLADIAQNVAGDRLRVDSLLPPATDPHSFESTPGDVRRLADADVVIIHGQGLEQPLGPALKSVRANALVAEASAGLKPTVREGDASGEPDMHFWLDPNFAVTYADNIRQALSKADPAGASVFETNARAYSAKLKDLDAWVRAQVDTVPSARKLLVTDHESLGYFADRYGFRYVGAVVPSVSPGAAPSAKEMASLLEAIRVSGAPAVFFELGTNRQLVDQIAREAGVKVGPPLYSHALSKSDGPAPNYIEMIKFDVNAIVQTLR